MALDHTRVWVRTSILNEAAGVSSKDKSDLDWGWARATLLSGSVEQAALDESDRHPVKVLVQDEDSRLDGVTVEIQPEVLAPKKPKFGGRGSSSRGASSRGASSRGASSTGAGKKSLDPPIVYANHCESAELDGDGSDAQMEAMGLGVVALLPPDDLIHLTHLHEASVVFSLRRRYARDVIYTSTGPILLAINPFKSCPRLYGEATMAEYFHHGESLLRVEGLGGEEGDDDGSEDEHKPLPPHIYGTADNAFREMMAGLERMGRPGGVTSFKANDQSILVSGESGAGKTVTTKHIMSYLATLSQRRGLFKKNSSPSLGLRKGALLPKPGMGKRLSRRISRTESWKKGAVVEERVLESNPILEAFGNARTIRNDNSSRFGKFIELQFKNTGSLIGAEIETYLLEKVRLVTQSPGERNYHVFYEILGGATEEEREQYFLSDYTVEDFSMTNQSGTYDRRDGVDDVDQFDKLFNAMRTMGFDPMEMEDIFSVTIACMHASNVTFKSLSADESVVDDSNPHLQPLLKLLGFTQDEFNKALCYFTITAGKEQHSRSLSKEKAQIGLEALTKATYGGLFDYLVQNINKRITYKPGIHDKAGSGKAAYIGVLDIFGFEVFKKNSFEQLCINYCNEALQQQFNKVVFQTEQVEYEKEGIEWSFIKYPDNQDVLDLIEDRGSGIIPILDDMCIAPGLRDLNFARDLYKKIKNPRFEANHLHVGKGHFVIHHYPVSVEYNTDGFIAKNKDELPREAKDLLLSSSKPFVTTLAKIISPPAAEGSPSAPRRAFGKKKVRTVGGQFITQLKKLRTRVDNTQSHYIRCLKPNQHLGPGDFNPVIVAEQLRSLGVVEAVRLSRTGFPQRFEHDLFLHRYSIIVLELMKGFAGSIVERCRALVGLVSKKIWIVDNSIGGQEMTEADKLEFAKDVKPGEVGIQMGKTKVFLREEAFESLERLRVEQMDGAVLHIQTQARVFLARKELQFLRREAEEKARREAEERARREAEERARREAEERARREAEERARREAEDKARREAEEKARREAEERARKEAQERMRQKAEEEKKAFELKRAKFAADERAKKDVAEKARREAEEKARLEAEERTRKEAEEQARCEAEERAKKEAEDRAREAAEEDARREAEVSAKKEAAEAIETKKIIAPQAPLEGGDHLESEDDEKFEDEGKSDGEEKSKDEPNMALDRANAAGSLRSSRFFQSKSRFGIRDKLSKRISGTSKRNGGTPRSVSFTLPPLHMGEYDVALPLTNVGFMINVGEIQGCVAFVSYRRFPDGTPGPAEKEGLVRNPGDKLVAINGVSTKSKSFREVVMLLAESRARGMAFVRFQESKYAYPGMRIQVYPPGP